MLSTRLQALPRDARDTLFLLAVIGLILLPQLPNLPWWCSTLAAIVLLWRGTLAVQGRPLPARGWRIALLALTLVATYSTYRTLLGRDAGVTLVVILLALKTLELRARRDAFVIFFLGFFTMLTNFFYSQSLATAFAMLLALLGLLTALVNAHMPVGKPPLAQARLADRHVGEHERGQQAPDRDQHRGGDRERLRIEEVRQHDEEAEEEHDEGVAAGAQLERLQRHQHHRHRHAGLLAEQGAVRPEGQPGRQQQHRDQHPAPGQRGATERELGAPEQHDQGQQRAPCRQVAGMRQHGPADHEQQEQGVARVARQVLPAQPQRCPQRLQRRERAPRRGRSGCVRRRLDHGHSASASRQRRRCAGPPAGAISTPGRRSP